MAKLFRQRQVHCQSQEKYFKLTLIYFPVYFLNSLALWVANPSHLAPKWAKTNHERYLAKTIYFIQVCRQGYSRICLSRPFFLCHGHYFGEIFGEFPLYTRMTDFKRVAKLSGVGCREAEMWRAVIKKQIRALIPHLPVCPDCCC